MYKYCIYNLDIKLYTEVDSGATNHSIITTSVGLSAGLDQLPSSLSHVKERNHNKTRIST